MTDSYRTEVPNIIDDLGLDPFERVLYLHYKRVCGAYGGICFEAVRTTAKKTKMATGMVTKARESLQARGLITTLARKHKNDTPNIMIVDIWDLNQAYYLEIGRPNVDGWTVEQLRQWVDSVHQVNAVEHNPAECSLDEDSHNKRSLHERSNDELSSSEQLPPEMPVSVHIVNENEHNKDERSPSETKKESSNPESNPKKESERESHAHKLKRIGEVDYLNQNEAFATELTEVCGNPHPRYVINGDRKKLAEATAQLLDWKVTIDQLDDFKTYWWGESPPRFEQVTKEWGRYLSSKQQLPRPPNGSPPANKSSPSKSAPIDMDLLRQKQEEALKGQ